MLSFIVILGSAILAGVEQHVTARLLLIVLPPCPHFLTTIISLTYRNQPLQKKSGRPTGESR